MQWNQSAEEDAKTNPSESLYNFMTESHLMKHIEEGNWSEGWETVPLKPPFNYFRCQKGVQGKLSKVYGYSN
jgi:hypothetical protein